MSLPALGQNIPSMPVQLRHHRVLEEFDGERLVEMRSDSGDPYLKIWFDTAPGLTRWLVLRSSSAELARFFAKQISLGSITSRPMDGFLYVLDERDGEEPDISIALPSEIQSMEIAPDPRTPGQLVADPEFAGPDQARLAEYAAKSALRRGELGGGFTAEELDDLAADQAKASREPVEEWISRLVDGDVQS